MRVGAFMYPWDLVGDPDAAHRVADLGVTQVTLAAAYHSTRALTPRHPRHRIVTARHSAVYYPVDAGHWPGPGPRPHEQRWMPGRDPYGQAAEQLAQAGIEVHSWVILAHNSRLGEEYPDSSVRNVYGDRYPWAPCIARPQVREYAVRLAAEAAVRPGTSGTELESCGWYGLEHLHAHDKTGGTPADAAGRYLMSLCFCEVCRAGYAAHGLDPEELRRKVTAALEPYWSGTAPAPPDGGDLREWAAVSRLLGEETAAAVAEWREATAGSFQREAVAAVRAAARERNGDGFRVLLHADPHPHRCGANAGARPAGLLAHADGVVLPCTGEDAVRTAMLEPFAAAARAADHGEPVTLAANFQVVSGMGGRPGTLAADAAHAAALGATELRLYHAGLASTEDLALAAAALPPKWASDNASSG